MSLYQPSFLYPHNEAIDVTNKDDMKFSWRLNGNNLLCAYNIKVFDADTNQKVFELVDTSNQEKIEDTINMYNGYLTNQNTKMELLDTYQEEYESSSLKAEFKSRLETNYGILLVNSSSKYNQMKTVYEKIQNNKPFDAQDITDYFKCWGEIITEVQDTIGSTSSSLTGEPIEPKVGSAEHILYQAENWMNVDPTRTDGVEYVGDVQLIDDEMFRTVKDEFSSYKGYYDNVMSSRVSLSTSDTSYINNETLTMAKKTIYLMYSKHTNESYYAKDLWAAVTKILSQVNLSKKIDECEEFYNKVLEDIKQESYALAHFNGGYVNQEINAYSAPSTATAGFLYKIPKGASVAIMSISPNPPSGWAYIIYDGVKAYIESKNLNYYQIQDGKYYLEKPVAPTSYNGNPNTIVHQMPTDILENGKSYKWSVTLYWSTSGKYNQDDKIDGQLTSIESYFEARKKPKVYLDNLQQIFSIPYNYVDVIKTTTLKYEDSDERLQTVDLNVGEKVLFLHLSEQNKDVAIARYTLPAGTEVEGEVELSCLSGVGNYDSKNYMLYSKYATFVGGYEQEQYTSVSYFRWVLNKLQYDTEEPVETLVDTGMIPSVDIKMFYDGFLNGEKYSIKLYVQTLDNVQVETEEYIFEVQYINISIENMVNAENSPIEHGIIVEWSNLRLIQGNVLGNSYYTEDLPIESHNALTLEKGSTLTFDKDKENPLSLSWDTNHIISMRIDEDRPEDQIYYSASGLDDNGEVIYKTLELVNRPDTDKTGIADFVYTVHTAMSHETYTEEIIASPLYWYIIIMKSDGFIVYKKYADGLFPARELYAAYNSFANNRAVMPLPLRYYDEPSERVNYNYQTIIRNDGTYRDEEE